MSSNVRGRPGKEVEIVYQYSAGRDFDDTLERGPLVQAWMAGVPMPAGEPIPVHRHRLVESAGSGSGGAHAYAPVRVALPYSASEWPRDASVRFLIFDQIQNSVGDWTYEKAASGEVFLADLLAAPAGKNLKADMRVQSYYMPTAADRRDPKMFARKRHKGVMHVGRKSVHPDVTWAAPTGFELVPSNYGSLQAAMMLAVGRSMSPFNAELVGKRAMRPTLANEIDNVHAPLYVQETPIGLDGATFFSLTPTEAAAHITGRHEGVESTKAYYETLIRQSLKRHDMSEREFVRAGETFAGGERRTTDHRLRIAAAAFASALTQRVNMMEYVADKVVLGNAAHEEPIVESFDQVDGRTDQVGDFGGARSRDVVVAPATSRFIGAPVSGRADRRVASGGAMDCEDGAKDAAIHFSTLTDPGVLSDAHIGDRPLLVAARRIGQKYRAAAVLTSVLSRNLTDATSKGGVGGSGRRVKIGSREDMNVKVGAHMFTVLIPEATLKRNISRAMKAHQPARTGGALPSGQRIKRGHSRRIGAAPSLVGASSNRPIARVDLGSYGESTAFRSGTGAIGSRVGSSGRAERGDKAVLKSGAALPALLCEGTGVLHPLMVPLDGYEDPKNVVGRKIAITRSILGQEAELRMRVGKGSDEVVGAVSGGGSEPQAHKSMSKFKSMHTQKELVDDPDTRLVQTFYRTAAEMYLIPTAKQVENRLAVARGGGGAKTRSGVPVLVGDRLIPMQIGGRQGEALKHGGAKATWGVAISDILRSSEVVGMLPTPHPSDTETQIVRRVGEHIAPPTSAWRLDMEREDDSDADPYIVAAKRWPEVFSAASKLPRARVASKTGSKARFIMAHAYGDPRKLKEADIGALGRWMRANPYVVGASLSMEYATYHLATVRLDALVDCGDTAQQSQSHIHKLLKKAPRRPPLPVEPIKVRASLPINLPNLTEFHKRVVARFYKHWMAM